MDRIIGLVILRSDGDVRIENKLVLNKTDGGTDNTFTFPTNRLMYKQP